MTWVAINNLLLLCSVCVCERERERASLCVHACVCVWWNEHFAINNLLLLCSVCVCVRERERETEQVCVCVHVCISLCVWWNEHILMQSGLLWHGVPEIIFYYIKQIMMMMIVNLWSTLNIHGKALLVAHFFQLFSHFQWFDIQFKKHATTRITIRYANIQLRK